MKHVIVDATTSTNETAKRIYKNGNGYLADSVQSSLRLPAGHPEGFIEAFANIYREAGRAMRAVDAGRQPENPDYPTVQDGARGVHFIHTAIESSNQRAWVDASYDPPA